MPYLAGRPRPRRSRGRRKSAVSRRAWPTTVMPRATAQRTRRARMNHASTRRMSGRSWCSTAPMRILASLPPSRSSSDRREARGRLRRRPGGPMTVESETRFCARTWVRFPSMVEPACGAWCFLRAAQEQCVVERHDAAVLPHEAIAHDAAERVNDVEPGEAVSLDHAKVGAPSPPGSDRRDGLCHVAREHAAEDEFHDGGARSDWDGVGDGLEPDQEDCRDAAVERYHRVPQSCR